MTYRKALPILMSYAFVEKGKETPTDCFVKNIKILTNFCLHHKHEFVPSLHHSLFFTPAAFQLPKIQADFGFRPLSMPCLIYSSSLWRSPRCSLNSGFLFPKPEYISLLYTFIVLYSSHLYDIYCNLSVYIHNSLFNVSL